MRRALEIVIIMGPLYGLVHILFACFKEADKEFVPAIFCDYITIANNEVLPY